MSSDAVGGDGAVDPDDPTYRYDEFAHFQENIDEFGLPWQGSVPCRRVALTPDLSALRWGTGAVSTLFLHGAAQNAHTWDTVLLALGCPAALAIDLPGHGHSAHRADGRYDPRQSAMSIGAAMSALRDSGQLGHSVVVVGMSLGGLTANALAARQPELVEALVVVDITPGVDADKAKAIHDFVAGPQRFDSFAEILERTVSFNPTRTRSSLRRGILHNAERMADGSWRWRYDRRQLDGVERPDAAELWGDVSASNAPLLFVKGADSPVVDEADLAELRRRRPDARVEVIEGAGHSIQGDRPVELANLIGPLLTTDPD